MTPPTAVARLICDQSTARRVADYLGETLDAEDTACAAFEDDDGQWQVAIHFRPAPDEDAVRALVAIAAGDAAAKALTFAHVATRDWVAESLAGLKPVRAGRFIIHGAHDRAQVKPNQIGIEIEAALAFGTGHHGTTRGCLLALDHLARRTRSTPIPPLKGEGRRALSASTRVFDARWRGGVGSRFGNPPPGRSAATLPRKRGRDKSVLDVGTGSGVLAIAAARRMPARVTASDIDPLAVQAAKGNARLNRAQAIRFVTAAGVKRRAMYLGAPYDLIFANILLGPLIRMAEPLSTLAARGARVVLSGLLPSHAHAVLAAYRAQGLVLERRVPLDGWMTLILHKP